MVHALTNRRLALGTAQFGMDYGVANTGGQVERTALVDILANAARAGLDTLDTAIAYGQSEVRLGELGVDNWCVVSKLPRLPDPAPADIHAWVLASVQGSLDRLRIPVLSALLLHHPADMLGAQGAHLARALADIKDRGLVRKTGVSIYAPAELDRLLATGVVDAIQAPLSIVDRRLVQSGWLDRLQQRGIEVHVRSVFLQGLLLMPAAQRPGRFAAWQGLWDRWDRWLLDSQLSALEACLRYVLGFDAIARVVTGVDSLAQLQQILAACDGELPDVPAILQSDDQRLINPALWQPA
jgi:aryl-alcohol dehydrogenase-like predicted oxidoreductase